MGPASPYFFWILLAVLMAAPMAAAEQQDYQSSAGFQVSHAFPSTTQAPGSVFFASGAAYAPSVGNTVGWGPVVAAGDCVVLETTWTNSTDQGASTWLAKFRMDGDSCAWAALVTGRASSTVELTFNAVGSVSGQGRQQFVGASEPGSMAGAFDYLPLILWGGLTFFFLTRGAIWPGLVSTMVVLGFFVPGFGFSMTWAWLMLLLVTWVHVLASDKIYGRFVRGKAGQQKQN